MSSEEKSYEVKANLEIATEGCDDEECKGCGEMHDAQSLEDALKKHRWMYRGMKAGYFISLLTFAGCTYKLVGLWGAVACAAAFGVHFFHLGMLGVIRILMALEQVTGRFSEILSSQAQQDKGAPEDWGQYL